MNFFFAVGRVSTFEVASVGTTFSCNVRLFSLAKVSRLLEWWFALYYVSNEVNGNKNLNVYTDFGIIVDLKIPAGPSWLGQTKPTVKPVFQHASGLHA